MIHRGVAEEGEDRDKPKTQGWRAGKRHGEEVDTLKIKAGVGLSSLADERRARGQELNGSKLAGGRVWGAGVLHHPELGVRVDR